MCLGNYIIVIAIRQIIVCPKIMPSLQKFYWFAELDNVHNRKLGTLCNGGISLLNVLVTVIVLGLPKWTKHQHVQLFLMKCFGICNFFIWMVNSEEKHIWICPRLYNTTSGAISNSTFEGINQKEILNMDLDNGIVIGCVPRRNKYKHKSSF